MFRSRKIRYMQYVCVIIVSLLYASLSVTSSWMSPSLPRLLSDDTPLKEPLTNNEEGWVVSMEKFGSLMGCIIAAFLTDRLGRKIILLLAAIPFILGMVTTAFSKIVEVLIVVRGIIGLGMGIALSISPVYISEISDKDIRGRLGLTQLLISNLGKVYIYSVGPFISYFALSLSCAVVPTMFFVLFVFMPETPYHLVRRGNSDGAKRSLQQMSVSNISEDELKSKLNEIEMFVVRDSEEKHKGLIRLLIFDRVNRKALYYALVLRTVMIFSGSFVILSYLQKLIEESGSSISPEVSSVIFGVITIPSVLLAAYLVDKVGRRPLYMVSSFGCAVALIAVGTFFYLKENGSVSDILWLPTLGLSMFIVFEFLGVGTLPGIIQGEIFSISVKAIASSIVSMFGSAIGFILFRFFQPLADKWGMYVMFWFFGGVSLVGFLFVIFVLPETKGKTFTEIQEILDGRTQSKPVSVEEVERY